MAHERLAPATARTMAEAKRRSDPIDRSPSVRELEMLRATIETRKLIAAAASLGITQSAVSRGIDSLEQKLNVALFRREAGRLVPTADAFALNDAAGTLFEGIAKIARWPNVVAESASLRIATSPTFAQHLIPDLISRFREVEPDAFVALQILTGSQVVSAVAEGLADVGIVDSFAVHPGVKADVFRHAEIHAFMPQGHPLARAGDITPADLRDVPLIVQPKRFAYRGQLERAFHRAGIEPLIAIEAATSGLAFDLMIRGVGVAVISPYPVELGAPGASIARRFVPVIQNRSALIFPAAGQVTPAARRFADILRVASGGDASSQAPL